jgi:hypothetical protein
MVTLVFGGCRTFLASFLSDKPVFLFLLLRQTPSGGDVCCSLPGDDENLFLILHKYINRSQMGMIGPSLKGLEGHTKRPF